MLSTQKPPAVGAFFSLLQHFVEALKSCQLFKIFLTPDSDQINQAVVGSRGLTLG